MIAVRRADVRELNARARRRMRSAGRLGEDVEFQIGTFATGDRVVLRRNDRRLGVSNGDVGEIVRCDLDLSMTVRVRGRDVVLPATYLTGTPARRSVEHAYAITGHVAQGMTVDRAHVLGSAELYREWGYTAMSRGRRSNKLYVVAPDSLGSRGLRAAGPPTSRCGGGARRAAQRDPRADRCGRCGDDALAQALADLGAARPARRPASDRCPGNACPAGQGARATRPARRGSQEADRCGRAHDREAQSVEALATSPIGAKAHRSGEDLHARSRSGLSRIRASVISEIAKRDESIELLRNRPSDVDLDSERLRIRDELTRRSAIERELDRPSERQRSAAAERD